MPKTKKPFALVLPVLIAFALSARGQVPREFDTWKTTDGYEAKGLFHSVDKEAGTVTLLVLKTLPLDRLDEKSRQIILKGQQSTDAEVLKQQESADPPVSKDRQTSDPQFTLKHTLDDPTYAEWQKATSEEKIALTGNWVFGLIRHDLASKKLKDAVQNANDLNLLALELYAQIELSVMVAKDKDKSFDPSNIKVSQIVALTTKSAGWLDDSRVSSFLKKNGEESNTRSVGDVVFSDLQLQKVGNKYRLIGVISNNGTRNYEVASYNLNFYIDGKLNDVETLMVVDLKAGSNQTFKAELYDVTQQPNLETMTITPTNVLSPNN